MSVRSLTKILLHLIWGTKNHEKILTDREFRKRVSDHLSENSKSKNIYMKINHVNAVIDLPTNRSVEEVMRLLKGELSHWINKELDSKFSWAIGYAVFSVSESNLAKVIRYIQNQDKHHRQKSFREEYDDFVTAYKVDIG